MLSDIHSSFARSCNLRKNEQLNSENRGKFPYSEAVIISRDEIASN